MMVHLQDSDKQIQSWITAYRHKSGTQLFRPREKR